MTEYQVDKYGTQRWYQNGQLHRTDGPAVIYPDGTQEWWINGQCHREDGPALIYSNGIQEWYINGKKCDPVDKFNINTNFNIKDGF